MKNFNEVAEQYASLIQTDPIKNYSQYPSVISFLGKVKGQTILDIGCGDGVLSRELTKRGAKVVGFDSSENQVQLAKNNTNGGDATYLVSDPQNFQSDILFDKAIAILVLPYAQDLEDLKAFFDCAYRSLKMGGEFLSVTFIPDASILGKEVFNRKFTPEADGKIRVDFLGKSNKFSAVVTNFTKEEYEACATGAGFKEFFWKDLEVTDNPLPENFWTEFKAHKPYQALFCRK